MGLQSSRIFDLLRDSEQLLVPALPSDPEERTVTNITGGAGAIVATLSNGSMVPLTEGLQETNNLLPLLPELAAYFRGLGAAQSASEALLETEIQPVSRNLTGGELAWELDGIIGDRGESLSSALWTSFSQKKIH